jgi:hypothetical protein
MSRITIYTRAGQRASGPADQRAGRVARRWPAQFGCCDNLKQARGDTAGREIQIAYLGMFRESVEHCRGGLGWRAARIIGRIRAPADLHLCAADR